MVVEAPILTARSISASCAPATYGLAHGAARRRELAVRTALGAGKRDLLGRMLAESLVLALAGGAVGIALAYGGTHLVAGLDARIPLLSGVAVDRSVLAFALVISIASGLVFGLLPAARASTVSPGVPVTVHRP